MVRGNTVSHTRLFDRDEIFNFIVDYKRAHDGVSPSYSELMTAFKIKSKNTVVYILGQLDAAGRIHLVDGQARSIEVVGGRWSFD